jgi:hypothetical protein
MTRSVFDYIHNFEAIFATPELAYGVEWGLEQNDTDSESDDLPPLAGLVCF